MSTFASITAALEGLTALPAAVLAHLPEVLGVSVLHYLENFLVTSNMLPSRTLLPTVIGESEMASNLAYAVEQSVKDVAIVSYLSLAGVRTYS